MDITNNAEVSIERLYIQSEPLEREVIIDCYLPPEFEESLQPDILLVNDGQDLVTMNFEKILEEVRQQTALHPLLCVGLHCGEDRKNEYGMLAGPDCYGWGSHAAQYDEFIFQELLPHLYGQFKQKSFRELSFAGFSLGGLSALDTVWNHPEVFSRAGVFSGALWWRSRDKNDKEYSEQTDRMMHRQIRKGKFAPGLKFFFQCGELDESADRNRNGVIDSIDDTVDVMKELMRKGYREGKDMKYLQLPDGKHDIASWARSFPAFLEWGWKK